MRIYLQSQVDLGFECDCQEKYGEGESWIKFAKTEKGGLYVDKFYGCCEPELSPDNLRILGEWLGDLIPAVRRGRTPLLHKRGKADI